MFEFAHPHMSHVCFRVPPLLKPVQLTHFSYPMPGLEPAPAHAPSTAARLTRHLLLLLAPMKQLDLLEPRLTSDSIRPATPRV